MCAALRVLIHWRDYCVWVEGDELEHTAEAILRHYERHTAESFVELQRRCRKLWVDFLSLDGFFRSFHRHAATPMPPKRRNRARPRMNPPPDIESLLAECRPHFEPANLEECRLVLEAFDFAREGFFIEVGANDPALTP